MAILNEKYDTGRLGLSDDEVHAELVSIANAARARYPGEHNVYFYMQTPQEIHREQVLMAIRLATSIICYHHDPDWNKYAAEYMFPRPLTAREPKFNGTEEQQAARALTQAEWDAIFAAQKERMARAKVIPHVCTDEDGFSYSHIQWN